SDQHADAFDQPVAEHQIDFDVFAFAFAANADDALPAGLRKLLANQLNILFVKFAFLVKLNALDVNALQHAEHLADGGLVGAVLVQKLRSDLQQRAVNIDINGFGRFGEKSVEVVDLQSGVLGEGGRRRAQRQ